MGPAPSSVGSEESLHDLELAARNHALPLEALRYPVTPAGLHYVLTHYDIPSVDPGRWRLRVTGGVRRELALSLGDISSLPFARNLVTMECAGNGRALLEPRTSGQPWLREAVGTAEWGGTPLVGVLEQAGVLGRAREVVFTGLDRGVEEGVEQRFARSLALEDALREEVLLAYEMNGRPLPPQHGFPLRLVVPGWYGMASVKWLEQITVVDTPFDGYQQRTAYRLRRLESEEGEPLSRMLPRALMAPPGIPELLSRQRFVPLAPCLVEGRAWSGHGPVDRVRVSTDKGATWNDADLQSQASPWSWTAWSYLWEPEGEGQYELACRAGDAAGNEQPLEGSWNLGGYANNAVQRVAVTVRAAAAGSEGGTASRPA
ncbi:MAG TPA: sulfite oxidase [Gaiellaceae bacterium]|nr:sulfite oxidase [Gaiellaceae bacterium]